MMNRGQRIMDGIIDGSLCHAKCAQDETHGCVIVWSSGAAEQIEAMAEGGQPLTSGELLGPSSIKSELELHQEAIDGIRKTILEAIAVLNGGHWGSHDSKERGDAIKCRTILRRIVPHDWSTGNELPTDILKMAERARRP